MGKSCLIFKIDDDNISLLNARQAAEKDSKLIADRIYTFAEAPKELWLQLQDKNQYFAEQQALEQLLRDRKSVV